MSKDPREGLRLRLGYEVAGEIERTPVIAPGVSDAAIRAVNSVLFQRLQEQVLDDNPTTQILEERTRDINITNIASENDINKADLIAVLQSGAFQGPPGDKGDKGDKGDTGPPGALGPTSGPSAGPSRPRSGKSGGPTMDETSGSSKRPPPPDDPPPPPKMMAMASPNVQAYAQNLELQAEIQGIREEMRKQQKQQEIAQELQNRLIAANANPRTEIIRSRTPDSHTAYDACSHGASAAQ